MSTPWRLLCVALLAVVAQREADAVDYPSQESFPPGRTHRSRRPPPKPAPAPPAVVFVSDLDVREAARIAPVFGAQNEAPVVPEAAVGRTSRRGTLVARTTSLSSRAVPPHLALVTAEGVRVTASELAGLALPFPLESDNVPPLPPGADRPQTPSSFSSTSSSPTPASPQAAPSHSTTSALSPPSPLTVVTYFSLGDEAKVKMLPYLQLVEQLVGKEAYARPRSSLQAPLPPPPSPVLQALLPLGSNGAEVYGPPAEVYGTAPHDFTPPLRSETRGPSPPQPPQPLSVLGDDGPWLAPPPHLSRSQNVTRIGRTAGAAQHPALHRGLRQGAAASGLRSVSKTSRRTGISTTAGVYESYPAATEVEHRYTSGPAGSDDRPDSATPVAFS